MDERNCHCSKDGHAINSINCPIHGKNKRALLSDQQLDDIGSTLHEVCKKLSETSGGAPFLIVWGCVNGMETVEGYSKTHNLKWDDACKILVGGTQYVSETFN